MEATTQQSAKVARQRGLVALLVMMATAALVLFGAAGTFDWPMAWLYLAMVTVMTLLRRSSSKPAAQ